MNYPAIALGVLVVVLWILLVRSHNQRISENTSSLMKIIDYDMANADLAKNQKPSVVVIPSMITEGMFIIYKLNSGMFLSQFGFDNDHTKAREFATHGLAVTRAKELNLNVVAIETLNIRNSHDEMVPA